MWFGSLATEEAIGGILAHSLATPDGVLKKGRRLSADDVARLTAAGYRMVTIARLGAGDIGEDAAAAHVAGAVAGAGVRVEPPFTGRANLYAEATGLASFDAAKLNALNLIDEGLTIATVAPFERVVPGQMIATVKVIPFALPETVIDAAVDLAQSAITICPFRARRAGLVMTSLRSTKRSVLDKRERAIRDRVEALGGTLAETVSVPHDVTAVAGAIAQLVGAACDPVLVFSASAIVDRGDIVPAGLVAAGGRVDHLGMPVDPGNLLMTGTLGACHVVGVPTCAASPKENGFDWVLARIFAGLPVGRPEIAAMGIGGLLKEISSRPQPRDERPEPEIRRAPRLAAVVLAAGRSSRMGAGRMKLLEHYRGEPMVRHACRAALDAGAAPVLVVIGHRGDDVRAAVADLPVEFVPNTRFAEGLSTSLAAGLEAVPASTDGAYILLADMPLVTGRELRRMAAAFSPPDGREIIVPTFRGQRGNPVLWSRMFFPRMMSLAGDQGARRLLTEADHVVAEVEMETDGILRDVDTPDALAGLTAID